MTQDQLKELERLNERWVNDAHWQPWEEKQITSGVMDLLPDVIAHVKQLTTERDAALKAFMEIRQLLVESPKPWRTTRGTAQQDREWFKRRGHALSTDCGKGYHHEREIGPLVDALKRALDRLDDAHHNQTLRMGRKALAHAEKLMEGK